MSEEIKEKTEIKEADAAETESADAVSETAASENTAVPEGAAASEPKTPDIKMEWRETLGLQLSDVEDYMVNAGAGDGSEELDDHPANGAALNAGVNEDARADSASVMQAGTETQLSAETQIGPETEKGRKKGGIVLAFFLGALCTLGILLLCARAGLLGGLAGGDPSYSGIDGSYAKFFEIMKMIGEDPIAEKDPKDITDEELKEIVASIGDPYAEYYTASEYEEQQKRYMNDFVGIGIGVSEEDGKVVIKTIFKDTPAEAAGMQAEDVIVSVDGTEPKNVDDAVSMITGEAGTEVTVTVRRGEELIDFTLKRAKIETDAVEYSPVPDHPDIGYITMSMFRKGTDDEFKEAVKELQGEGCDKFIIDLRDNGGGLTDVCIEIADYLLPSCKIMSENTKRGEETVYNSKSGSADLKLIVLVNENTASASEILTAALQDNGACTVIGTNTYGKGVIQIMHQFDDGSAVKITTSEYFRPNGKPVNGVGITPDIETEGDALDAAIQEFAK